MSVKLNLKSESFKHTYQKSQILSKIDFTCAALYKITLRTRLRSQKRTENKFYYFQT